MSINSKASVARSWATWRGLSAPISGHRLVASAAIASLISLVTGFCQPNPGASQRKLQLAVFGAGKGRVPTPGNEAVSDILTALELDGRVILATPHAGAFFCKRTRWYTNDKRDRYGRDGSEHFATGDGN